MPSLSVAGFGSATECAVCHPQHYREWSNSSHAWAMRDPVFRRLIELQRADNEGEGDLFCTQCHSAIGTRSGDIRRGFDFDALNEVTMEGVSCETCHRATAMERDYNAGHVIDAEAPLQGPLEDSSPPHEAARSELLQSSRFCGGCHDVTTPSGVELEAPYAEWMQSPASDVDTKCQDCHMPTYSGTAAVTPDAPEREELHRHTFTGVDVPLRLATETDDEELLEQLQGNSERLLKSAVDLTMDARFEGSAALLTVEVRNRIEGHRFPTGSSFNRQFWLMLEARDAEGNLLFESGQLDPDDDLYDAFNSDAENVDPDLVLLGTYLLDADDQVTLFPWRAVSTREERIGPDSARSYNYTMDIPDDAEMPIEVTARLRFRAFSPRLLRELGLDEYLDQLEIVDMADCSATLDRGD